MEYTVNKPGEAYEMRCGGRIVITEDLGDRAFLPLGSEEAGNRWSRTGRFELREEHPFDLIDLWKDSSLRWETPQTIPQDGTEILVIGSFSSSKFCLVKWQDDKGWVIQDGEATGKCILSHQINGWIKLPIPWGNIELTSPGREIKGILPMGRDGWIEWHGGENPLGDKEVEVRLMHPGGFVSVLTFACASDLEWSHEGANHHKIGAYRILANDEPKRLSLQSGTTEKPLIIEAGKFYKVGSGAKYYVGAIVPKEIAGEYCVLGYVVCSHAAHTHSLKGLHIHGHPDAHIVSEWEEPKPEPGFIEFTLRALSLQNSDGSYVVMPSIENIKDTRTNEEHLKRPRRQFKLRYTEGGKIEDVTDE